MKKLHLLKTNFVVFVFCAVTAMAASAQTLITLHNFRLSDGSDPQAVLVQGADTNFYGTTSYGGADSDGTVFQITPSGTLTLLHSFDYTDGYDPSGLALGADGNFYGTTYNGGTHDYGTVFKITPAGALTTLHSFAASDGALPEAGLAPGTDGNFYGTTEEGGANNVGTVFKITPGGALTTLYNFCSQANCADGSYPQGGLIEAGDGNFYGTTPSGGTSGNCSGGCGTVFRITPNGTLTTLHSFQGADGSSPQAGLAAGSDGNLYGTTYGGGANLRGTVFKITPQGTLTTLYSFCSQDGCPDGWGPEAPLVQATDGNFYGTTSAGGANYDYGSIFAITPQGTLTTLYSFGGADGSVPGGLVQSTDGSFYGTTQEGGQFGDGTVFSLSTGLVLGPIQFVPATPCRLLDTRPQDGGNGAIQGGTYQTFILPQLARQNGCADLSSAAAYSLNVTAVPHEPLGFLTIWPAGQNLPPVSTLNSVDGRVKASAAIVPGGVSQAVSVYVSDTSDVILDIDGYFAPSSGSTLAFYTLPPCRVADTRDSTYPPGLGPPYLSANQERDFPLLNSPCLPQAAAFSFNLTVVPHAPLGYLSVWPYGQSQPVVSTLNAVTGAVTANAAIVPAGTGGEIATLASSDTDLLIDVNGYFAAPGQSNALQLYPVVPCRVLDTRNGNGAFSGELTVDVVDSACAPSSTAQAYVLNATVVPSGPLGYLTLWPDGGSQPLVSTLNAVDGTITSNMAIVPTTDGQIDAYASSLTQLLLDISSYFAP